MKLNFNALAQQIDNQEQSDSQAAISPPQLNYYSKQTTQQKQNSTIRQRKSQLSEQSSQLLLGSSILESYFSTAKQTKTVEERQPRVNLSVMYPYQISKSLSPSNIDREIQDMKAKGILNESAMKFLKKQIIKDFSKSKQKTNLERLNRSLDHAHESIYFQTTSSADGDTNDFLNITQKSFENPSNNSTLGTTVSSKLFKNLLKESTQQFITNSKQPTQSQQQSVEQFLTSSIKKKKPSSKPISQLTKPHYMNLIHQKEKLKQQQKQLVPTQTLKQEQQLRELKSKPSLELTKSSPFTQRINHQRQSQYQSKKTNVFENLYGEAYKRQCMQMLEKESKEKEIDHKINMKKTLETNRAKKYKVEGNFLERLQKSIQRKYYKDYLTKKYSVNPKTGHPLFTPDTNLSKHTYDELFSKSLEKLKSEPNDSVILATTLKSQLSKKKTNKKLSEIALSTHFSQTQKSVKQTKYNSKQKLSQIDRLNRSMEIIPNGKKQLSESRSLAIVQKRDSKMVERIVRLFYPGSNGEKDELGKNKSLQKGEEMGFQKTYEALHQLAEQQYLILSPLFEQIQTLQKSSKVTSLIFRNLFTQFYKRLNHYDQVILRDKDQKKTLKQGKFQKTSQKINNFQKSQDIEKRILNEQKRNHRPKINEISASMEKINPKYEAVLYYV